MEGGSVAEGGEQCGCAVSKSSPKAEPLDSLQSEKWTENKLPCTLRAWKPMGGVRTRQSVCASDEDGMTEGLLVGNPVTCQGGRGSLSKVQGGTLWIDFDHSPPFSLPAL